MRHRAFALSVFLGIAGIAVSGDVLAQDAQDGEFSVQRFEPAPGPYNFVTVQGARSTGQMTWSAGLFGSYAYKPFVVRSCVSETDCDSSNALNPQDISVVRDLISADILGSLTPIEKLQIGLRLPLVYTKGDGIDTDTGQAARGGFSGFMLGDPYLEGKYQFYGDGSSPIGAAGGLFFTAPVGHAAADGKYIGYSSPAGGLRGIVDFRSGPFSAAANLAGIFRGTTRLGSTELGPEFRYGAGLGYAVSPVFRLLTEGYGATKFSTKNGTNSLEALLAGQVTPLQSRLAITFGAGAGVIEGVGVPVFRGFLGLMYVHAPTDADGDGLLDNDDQCPDEAEDMDNHQDEDGCPDPDNDGDAIPDDRDKCPNKPETMNGNEDSDGCPDDIPDEDKDAVPDNEDKCLGEGGEVIRVRGPHYGCPDTDKDGVADKVDQCKTEKEDTDGFQDTDGCPDPDNDGDGVPDIEDQCIDEAGTAETGGCPE